LRLPSASSEAAEEERPMDGMGAVGEVTTAAGEAAATPPLTTALTTAAGEAAATPPLTTALTTTPALDGL
jgi:hypothetical protein